jgi:predicted dehydrogenase
MDEIRIGVIGFGARAGGLAKRLLKDDPKAKLIAVCDPNDKCAANAQAVEGQQVEREDDYAALCARSDINLVMIGSPNYLHREHAVAALEAGKHVFCEKPLATNLEDCLAIRDAQRRASGCKFVVGFTLRFSPHYRTVRKLIAEGKIGELISFEYNETLDWNHGGFIHSDWRRHRSQAGTHLLEKCSHDVDLANWMVGARVQRCASFGGLKFFTPDNAHHEQRIGPHPENGKLAFRSWRPQYCSPFNDDKDIIDHQVAILEYANGVCATFHASCLAGIPERRMYLLGTEGAIRADVIAGTIELKRIGWDTKIEQVDAGVSGGHGGGDEVLLKELAAVVRGEMEPASTLSDGLEAAATCFGIDRAMDENTLVDLTADWQRIDA